MTAIKKELAYGDHVLTLETGEIARQAGGAVVSSLGDTVVLVTAVGNRNSVPGRDFFPLTVDYQEKTYSAGKIPGGFFKREGRPSEKETLTCRLIDRPVRPLFPKGFNNEVHIMATVMSLDPDIDPDIPAMAGASAALALSGMPFQGPIGAARVGFRDGQYLLNPTLTELQESQLNLVVAGTDNAVLMVESEAQVLSEQQMLDAVLFGHEQMQPLISMIVELAEQAGKPSWDWAVEPVDETLRSQVEELAGEPLRRGYRISDKVARQEEVKAARVNTVEALTAAEDSQWSATEVLEIFSKLEKSIVRGWILSGEARIDGRNPSEVRQINGRVGGFPPTPGAVWSV